MRRERAPGRRVRPLLLVLLWIWALCVFTVVDLFRNVPEFDGIRPRAPLYRGMRIAAHELVGEPCIEAPPAPRQIELPRDPLDERTWDLFLALLEARDLVVAKLPLTERRGDLDFLDVTLTAVAHEGTPVQRDRLARWAEAQLENESDAGARARLALCLETLQGEEG